MDSSKLGSRLLIRDQTISILISNFLNSYKMLWYYLIYSLFISIHGKKVMRVIGNLFVFRGQCAGWRIFKYILEIHRKKMYCVAILNSYIFCGGKLTIIIFLNQFSMEYLLSVHKIIYKLTTFYKISVYHNVFDRCLKCDLRYFYITSCIRKIVQIHHSTFACMYICLLFVVHTSILKMADFNPVHCLFLHRQISNHRTFRSAGHFALSNETVGIQILWTTFVLKYRVAF